MVLFVNAPVVPILFFIHECKTTATHKEFFEVAMDLLPNLPETCTPLVTDQEAGILRAIRDVVQYTHILGWNHMPQDIKWYAKMNNCGFPDIRDVR